MKYLALIYQDDDAEAAKGPDAVNKMMADYYKFTTNVREAGVYAAGEALHPAATATTVRVRDGKTQTTDGPFAETKEQLGGYYVLECKDLDEAIEWAAQIPHAGECCVEIRPVMVFG